MTAAFLLIETDARREHTQNITVMGLVCTAVTKACMLGEYGKKY